MGRIERSATRAEPAHLSLRSGEERVLEESTNDVDGRLKTDEGTGIPVASQAETVA